MDYAGEGVQYVAHVWSRRLRSGVQPAAAMYTRGRSLPARRRSVSSRRGLSTQRSDDYLYRCMRGDRKDLESTGREEELVGLRDRDHVKFVRMVLMSIGYGVETAKT